MEHSEGPGSYLHTDILNKILKFIMVRNWEFIIPTLLFEEIFCQLLQLIKIVLKI